MKCERCHEEKQTLTELRSGRTEELNWPVHWCWDCIEKVEYIKQEGEDSEKPGETNFNLEGYQLSDREAFIEEAKKKLERNTEVKPVRKHGMEARYLSTCKTGFENNQDFCCITIHAKPDSKNPRRVATFIEYQENSVHDYSSRKAKIFIERSAGTKWLNKVFDLINEKDVRGLISGGKEKIEKNQQIEIEEDKGYVYVLDKKQETIYSNEEFGGRIEEANFKC